MKVATPFLVIVALGALLCLFLPWYSIALAGIVGGLTMRNGTFAGAFALGLLAGGVLWGTYSGWIDAQNGSVLSGKIGDMLGGLAAWRIVAITSLLGGVYAGLGAVSGYYLRQIWARQ
ncbi:MAG: hypothetical protein R2795_06010 [Saprospiraceae bacterium]